MLRYALSVCKQKGMDRVILGCYKDNLASAATIKKNGGQIIGDFKDLKYIIHIPSGSIFRRTKEVSVHLVNE